MTSNDMLRSLVQKHGIDGLLNCLSDCLEEQAEEHEAARPASAEAYDRLAGRVRKLAAEAREMLS